MPGADRTWEDRHGAMLYHAWVAGDMDRPSSLWEEQNHLAKPLKGAGPR